MTFTDQKPHVVTAAHCTYHWLGGFSCKLCGHKFQEGDTFRWISAPPEANVPDFLTCSTCDGPNVVKEAAETWAIALRYSRLWNIYGPDHLDRLEDQP